MEPANWVYLNIDQVLDDYNLLARMLKDAFGFGKSNPAIVAMGGGYGGMIATWLWMKYPQTF